jgi:D-glycero-beta-D-manno-heptose 1-phosphate adenylyltransferase
MTSPLATPKLMTLETAVAARAFLRRAGQRLVLTNGVFDLMHAGHLHALAAAKAKGEVLWVALNGDASVRALKGPSRPIQSEAERAYALAALACVDGVVIFNTSRLDAEIRALAPDGYVKSGDYTPERLDPVEREALAAVGARVEFVPFLAGYSTTDLIARIRAEE